VCANKQNEISVNKKVSIVMICVLLFLNVAVTSSAALSWSNGNRVHVVVICGSATTIESGYITEIDGNMCHVKWDQCSCETLVPVENLHRSLSSAQKASEEQNRGEISYNDAAKSAGKMGLLYLLLIQRWRK